MKKIHSVKTLRSKRLTVWSEWEKEDRKETKFVQDITQLVMINSLNDLFCLDKQKHTFFSLNEDIEKLFYNFEIATMSIISSPCDDYI